MAAYHQPDEHVATYQILPSYRELNSTESADSNEEPMSVEITNSNFVPLQPAWTFASVNFQDDFIQKNRITIYKPHERIKNVNNYTHLAHVVLGTWNANLLCKYDEPAGVLHHANVISMGEDMQKATGWCWQDEKKPLTWDEDVEEQRAQMKYGVYKKPRSGTVGLCTLKQRNEAGWPLLELRTRVVSVKGEENGKDGGKRMVSWIAKKVVGAVQNTVLRVVEPAILRQNDARDEKGNEDEDEGKMGDDKFLTEESGSA